MVAAYAPAPAPAAQLDLVPPHAPQDRHDGGVDNRELVAEEERLDLEDIGALQDGVAQFLLELNLQLRVGFALDALGPCVPVALDAKQRQAELRPHHRIDRHQRWMRKALVQVFHDGTRVVQHVAVHQGRQG
jgi:hypothetical protein